MSGGNHKEMSIKEAREQEAQLLREREQCEGELSYIDDKLIAVRAFIREQEAGKGP